MPFTQVSQEQQDAANRANPSGQLLESDNVLPSTQRIEVDTIDYKTIGVNNTELLLGSIRENEAQFKQQEDISKATWFMNDKDGSLLGRKWSGVGAMLRDTQVGQIINYFEFDRQFFREEDKNFTDNFSQDDVLEYAKQYGIYNTDSIETISNAKSVDHLHDLIFMEIEKQKRSEVVQSALTSTEQTVAMIAEEMGTDPTLAIGFGASALYKTGRLSEKVSSVATKVAVAGELGYGAMVGEISDDMTMTEAMLIYGIAGLVEYRALSDIGSKYAKAPTPEFINMARAEKDAMTISEASKEMSLTEYAKTIEGRREYTKQRLLAAEKGSPFEAKLRNELEQLDIEQYGSKEIADIHNELNYLTETKLKSVAEGSPAEQKVLNQIKTTEKKLDNAVKDLDKQIAKTTKVKELEQLNKYRQKAVKARIKARVYGGSRYIGFKRFLNRTAEIKPKEQLTVKQASLINQTLRDIEDIANDVEMSITGIKQDMKALSTIDKDVAEDVFSVYDYMHKQGYLSNSAYGQIENAFKKGVTKHPKMQLQISKDGKDAVLKVNGKKVRKLPAAIVASLIAAGVLNADDGSFIPDSASLILLGIGAMILGVPQAMAKSYKSIAAGRAFNDASNITKKAINYAKTRKLRSAISEIADKANNDLMTTIHGMLKDTEGKAREIIEKFYYNPLDTKNNVNIRKEQMYNRYNLSFRKEVGKFYQDWLRDGGVNKFEQISSAVKLSSKRVEFDKLVYEYGKYGKHADNKHVVAAFDTWKRMTDDFFSELEAAGVKGAESGKKIDNYIPRIAKRDEMKSLRVGVTEESWDGFVIEFSKVFTKAKDPVKTAREYINLIVEGDMDLLTVKKNRDILRSTMKKKGLSEEDIESIIDETRDISSRLKRRATIDETLFNGYELKYKDGSTYKITSDDVWETSISNLAANYFNSMSGHLAIQTVFGKTSDELLDIAESIALPPSRRKTLIRDIKATVGMPSIDYSENANKIAKLLANATIAKGMVYSTISLMSEGFVAATYALRTSGVIKGMQQLGKRFMNDFGEDAFVTNEIAFGNRGMGLGMDRYSASYGTTKAFETASGNLDSAAYGARGNMIDRTLQVTEMARDFTLHTLPFVRTSDFFTKLNMQDILNATFNHLTGKKNFMEYELKAYPMSEKLKAKLSKSMQMNKDGNVKWFDYTQWDDTMQNEFRDMMNHMMLKRMNKASMGTTGAWSRNSALGVGLMPMLKYPMSATSNIGGFIGRGTLSGDPFMVMQSMLWLQAGMLQSIIRAELQGRDYDTNDVILAGLVNHPFMGFPSVVAGIGDNPVAKTVEGITSIVNPYNYTLVEE